MYSAGAERRPPSDLQRRLRGEKNEGGERKGLKQRKEKTYSSHSGTCPRKGSRQRAEKNNVLVDGALDEEGERYSGDPASLSPGADGTDSPPCGREIKTCPVVTSCGIRQVQRG